MILLYEPIHDDALALLRARANIRFAESLDEDWLVTAVADVEGIIVRANGRVTRRIIEAAPRLKVIGRHGVGVESIDREAAAERGIVVVNTPDANVESVAEHCVGMMIALAKKLVQSDQALRSGDWDARHKLTGRELFQKVIGVVGFGRIGQRVASICHRAFDMSVLYNDLLDRPLMETELGARRVALEALLEHADVVSLHVPCAPGTSHLIDEAALGRMKRTAFLINTSRGSVVDQTALLKALQAGWIAGAGLDVFEPEPLPGGHPLLTLSNVIVTPHMAAHTEEALIRMAQVANDVLAVVEGNVPAHPVPPPFDGPTRVKWALRGS